MSFCLLGAAIALSSMSVEEKIGQVLMAHFYGEEGREEEARVLVEEVHVGGVIYYNWANALTSPQQVQRLSLALQEHARIPLFIAVDQEGGKVSRLEEGFTHFYGNGALGIADDPELAEEAGFAMGEELHAVGINLNFAPVVDVSRPEQHPLDGLRRFGSSAEKTAVLGRKMLQGFHRAGVLGTLKHFPGYGDVSADAHLSAAVLDRPLEALWKTDLYPFVQLVKDADMIMTGHILAPALDPDHPATLSRAILEGLLREKIGYEGVIISDSLVMEGVLQAVPTVEEAALQAFEAGCDILLLGGKQLLEGQQGFELRAEDVRRIHAYLVDAVRKQRIPLERLDASVERILKLKVKISFPSVSEEDIVRSVGTMAHLEIANRIFDRSLRCAKPAQPINSE